MKNTEKRLVRIRERRAEREAQLRALRKIRDAQMQRPAKDSRLLNCCLSLSKMAGLDPYIYPLRALQRFMLSYKIASKFEKRGLN